MSEVCIIRVEMNERIMPSYGIDLENTVKNAWGQMVPWFTNRHGVRNGEISLNDGSVRVTWQYEHIDDDEALRI